MSPLAALTPASLRALDLRLFRYARRRTPSDDAARELVQRTWLAAAAGQHRFAGRSQLSTWLHGILRRKVADFYRERTAARNVRDGDLVSPPAFDAACDARRRLGRVASAMAELPPSERRALEGCVLPLQEAWQNLGLK
ncbi:MAG: RNA polymerase sigma factor [Myxococcota bacterium]